MLTRNYATHEFTCIYLTIYLLLDIIKIKICRFEMHSWQITNSKILIFYVHLKYWWQYDAQSRSIWNNDINLMKI